MLVLLKTMLLLMDDFNVVNPEGLRFSTEFVRHKILDTNVHCEIDGPEVPINGWSSYS